MLNLALMFRHKGRVEHFYSGNALGKALQVFEIQYTDDHGNIISSVYGESAATVAEVWDNDGMRVAVLDFYETWTVRDILPEYEVTANGDLLYSHRFTSVRDFVAMLETALETV